MAVEYLSVKEQELLTQQMSHFGQFEGPKNLETAETLYASLIKAGAKGMYTHYVIPDTGTTGTMISVARYLQAFSGKRVLLFVDVKSNRAHHKRHPKTENLIYRLDMIDHMARGLRNAILLCDFGYSDSGRVLEQERRKEQLQHLHFASFHNFVFIADANLVPDFLKAVDNIS